MSAGADADAVIECGDLHKTYRDFWGRRTEPALRGVDLVVRKGESRALLGPNGSGKTTTLRILLGLLRPTSGEARLFGRPPTEAAARRRVGFLPESSSLHGFLRTSETLEIHGRLHGLARGVRKARAGKLLEAVALADAAKKRVRELSHGMRRRLALAVALVAEPELLILDEPTAGMDPLVREHILALLVAHVERGGSLLVTSHLLGDLSGIATRATLLADGRVVREGDLETLLVREGERAYRVRGGAELDAAVRRAIEAAGGSLLDAGAARSSIEQLFLDTYRDDAGEAPGGDAS